jgi:hypothetical protein
MRTPLHRRAPKISRRGVLHRTSDFDLENEEPSFNYRVGAVIQHALTVISVTLLSILALARFRGNAEGEHLISYRPLVSFSRGRLSIRP